MIHGHGDDSYCFKRPIVANFSTNVWHGGKSTVLRDHIFKSWDKVYSYPEAAAESLTCLIANHNHLDISQVLVTNGATEAFYLIAQAYQESISTIVIPTFAEYEDACNINRHKIEYIHWDNLDSTTLFSKGLAWICNPNNPDGRILELDVLETLLKNHTQTIFVVDEAYIDFTDDISSAIDFINMYTNLILVKSLTKNFSIPGLRLGYLTSSKELVQNIQFYKAPWSVNSMAIAAGNFIFQHYEKFSPPVSYYKSDAEKFYEKLSLIPGLKIRPSKTSYFLVELEKGSAWELKKYLVNEFGLLIRDASNFRGLDDRYFRVSTQSEKHNQLLIDAIKKWIILN